MMKIPLGKNDSDEGIPVAGELDSTYKRVL